MERTATCSCGRLSAKCLGQPARISICACFDCQRRTGSPFSHNATFAREQVETSGDFLSFRRTSEEGFWAAHHFCPNCGNTVFYEIERRPGMISVPVGGFADPSFPEPQVSVYGERRPAWLAIKTASGIEET